MPTGPKGEKRPADVVDAMDAELPLRSAALVRTHRLNFKGRSYRRLRTVLEDAL
jgi:hypothetical protein